MKVFVTRLLVALACLNLTPARAQTTYYMQGLLRQPSADTAKAYLQINTNGGSGTVTNFSAGNFSPLFTTSVLNPGTDPALSFVPIGQAAHLFFASPVGGVGFPSFRAIDPTDLPGGSGTVTSFSSGNLSPLFTTSVATPTTTPAQTFSLNNQSANLVFAGPNTGPAAAPTFRSLVAADMPDLSGTYLVSITNDGRNVGAQSLVSSSNAPFAGLKSLLAGSGASLASTETNITISVIPSGTSGIDLARVDTFAYANGTNFNIDFTYPAQTLWATGDIAFNYSTNWGLANTSRVANVYIPATNLLRHVLFLAAATNWNSLSRPWVAVPAGYGAKVSFQLFGVGETNVGFQPDIDVTPTGTNWITTGFNPTNSQGGCVLWWEASQQVWQDEYATVPVADGLNVRAWTDISLHSGNATNASMSPLIFFHAPNNSPGNIPSINFQPGGPDQLTSSNFSADLGQTNWAFIMFYGRGSDLIFLDGLSEGHRFACQVSETPAVPIAVYSGSTVSVNPGPVGPRWMLFSFRQATTVSVIRTNGVQAATGNSGTQSPGRWTIGSDYVPSTSRGNAYCAEVVVYHTNLSNLQVTNVENYFRTKYGAW